MYASDETKVAFLEGDVEIAYSITGNELEELEGIRELINVDVFKSIEGL